MAALQRSRAIEVAPWTIAFFEAPPGTRRW
jgi:hypothetical protein